MNRKRKRQLPQKNHRIQTKINRITSSKPSAGTYVANYDMKERADASLSAEQVGHIKKGDSLDIVEVVDNGDGSYWGKLSNGQYVCVKDNEYQYLS